jgi:hypothetical protein
VRFSFPQNPGMMNIAENSEGVMGFANWVVHFLMIESNIYIGDHGCD